MSKYMAGMSVRCSRRCQTALRPGSILSLPRCADEKSYRAALREQTRCHKLAADGELTKERILSHYQEHLSEYEKQKNYQPFNNMLKLMRKFDGVRIYQYDSWV